MWEHNPTLKDKQQQTVAMILSLKHKIIPR